MISESSTSPTLPSGYIKKRRVGAVRNDGSNNFLRFTQEGNKINHLDGLTNYRIVNAGTATTWATVSAASYVPPTSDHAIFWLGGSVTHNVAWTNFVVYTRRIGSGATYGQGGLVLRPAVAGVILTAAHPVDQTLDGYSQFDDQFSAAPSDFRAAYIDVLGYYDRI